MRERKRVVHQEVIEVEAKVGWLLLELLRWLDRHCRSHNIAAECCVESRSESVFGLASGSSKAGGRVVGKARSLGSSLMMGMVS